MHTDTMLSKSLYVKGLQCQKLLWLYKHNKAVITPPNADTKARFNQGNTVGGLACSLFPDGREIPFDGTTFNQKIAVTKDWLTMEVPLFEGTFEFDGVLVMVDVLSRSSGGGFEIYEIKSSTHAKDSYIQDAAIQYYVLKNLGYFVYKTYITILNKDYIRGDDLDVEQLFTHVDVTDDVIAMQDHIPYYLDKFREVLENKIEPDIDIGAHCTKPYPCDAINYCWKQQRNIPDYSVFNIFPMGRGSKAIQLYQEGVIAVENIPDDMRLTENQQSKVDRWKSHKTVVVKEAIKNFVGSISYPIYHFDFETMGPSFPELKGMKPYGKFGTQLSLHIEQEDGSLEHKEYLATPGQDPREEIAKRMVEEIPKNSCVIAYNIGFEKSIIRTLADNYPVYADHLMNIHDNFIDLAIPFQKGYYWKPEMQGHYGLKYVLPAIVPEMKDAYPNLDGVHNGGDAMRMFVELGKATDPHEIIKIQTALLEYCKLDTYAMVMILRSLRKLVDTPTNS